MNSLIYKQIQAEPNSDTIFMILFEMLYHCKQVKGHDYYVFKIAKNFELDLRVLSIVLKREEKDIAKALVVFEKLGVIQLYKTEILILQFWKDTKERATKNYELWRKTIFERDKYTCQSCGAKGQIEAHHIKEWAKYPMLRYDLDNGITLCKNCHKKTHGKRS